MAHLVKAASGHLYKNADGHLVNRAWCNCCDPALPLIFYVTLAGLAGDLAAHNGKTALTWTAEYPGLDCLWIDQYPNPTLAMRWYDDAGGYWIVSAQPNQLCFFQWVSDSPDGCDPYTTAYSFQECENSWCDDSDSCTHSAGATCNVTTS